MSLCAPTTLPILLLPYLNVHLYSLPPVACVFLGVSQQALLLPSPSSPAVLAAWLLWTLLAHLLLQIHSCILRREGTTYRTL